MCGNLQASISSAIKGGGSRFDLGLHETGGAHATPLASQSGAEAQTREGETGDELHTSFFDTVSNSIEDLK